ncbi:thiamine diphosphokinase [Lactobacillus selangorensis]|uniref:Thiamine diphosphokinase n=1 Tax=Lactobacillus selangorensis TaxID=81857 RepID=A0A0R2FZC6_9LACO|nr:thiamine diphosphokinase [Lactobacillus selangorensis]KRN29644.1 thiamine diphosphokinase [Lactobacillus selangorensis]KRN33827.1 thiamine diphosphokinase [Lactobacillus selangorensis]
MQRINLLVGGPEVLWPAQLKTAPTAIPGGWLGIDRGSLRLLKMGIVPQIAIGDFDSLHHTELHQLEKKVPDIRYSIPEKDDTDTELGLKTALFDLQADQVAIYGATGGRLDHFLVNLFMVLEPRFKPYCERVMLLDRQNSIRFYRPGAHVIQKEPDKRYLAFVPLTAVTGLTLPDEKYRLEQADSVDPISWASNEFIGTTGHFSFTSGVVAVIQSSDLNGQKADAPV